MSDLPIDQNQGQPTDDPELKKLLTDLAVENAKESSNVPIVAVQNSLPIEPVNNDPQIIEFVKKFSEVSNDILGNYKADRDQINDTIEYLENIVFNSGGERVHVEMLVAALRSKSETNLTAAKVLDSYAKFLAATKGTNIFIQNNNSGIAQDDLQKILARAPYPDEMRVDAPNK